MAGQRRIIHLTFTQEEVHLLERLARSRTEAASRVERARMLLAYRENPSFYAVGRATGVTHQTVERCIRRAESQGILAALDDSPRPGRARVITQEARTFITDLACRKPKDLGYAHELWTTRLLTRHIREHGPQAGHACLANLVQGTLCKILASYELKPHKVRYYLERRDPLFEEKMAEILCIYREVALLKETPPAEKLDPPAIAIISYDEKPGVQAIGTTAPDLPPATLSHNCTSRDHEYVRHGTLSLLAGIDLISGVVHASVEERHRSREFIEFLKKLDQAYPASTSIKIILDNHSAHVSKETKAWTDAQPDGRFTFVFTPKHGSWLNLVEGFFSKLARSTLRHIRVNSVAELKDRMVAAIEHINRDPVVHTWKYKMHETA